MADDTTRGVHLNEKQLVFVLTAAGVVCGVMFLFGVLVGRGVQADRGSAADATMISAPQVVPDPQPPADAAGAKPTGSQTGDLAYAKRLSEPDAPVEPLKPQATVLPPAAPAAPAAGAAVSADEPRPPLQAPDEPPAARGTAPTPEGTFTVQVTAVPKRSDADVVVRRLKVTGYDAFVVPPKAGDKTGVFRVRIGAYKTRADAEAVARKIESEGKYTPWVTR